jgi:hypothetical protein
MIPKVSWRIRAVVNDDSKEFAEELEKVLNEGTQAGYMLSNFISRDSDQGMVCVMQRPETSVEEIGVSGPQMRKCKDSN